MRDHRIGPGPSRAEATPPERGHLPAEDQDVHLLADAAAGGICLIAAAYPESLIRSGPINPNSIAMTAPNSFKGFGIPTTIKIVPLHDHGPDELKRVTAAYLAQGVSKERATHLLALSRFFLAMEQAGFEQGKDYRYDSALRAVFLSAAAQTHLAGKMPPAVLRQLSQQLIPCPSKLEEGDASTGEREPTLTLRGAAKLMTQAIAGLMPTDDQGVTATRNAAHALRAIGLPEEDITDLLEAARSRADGALARLVQRLEEGLIALFQREGGEPTWPTPGR